MNNNYQIIDLGDNINDIYIINSLFHIIIIVHGIFIFLFLYLIMKL